MEFGRVSAAELDKIDFTLPGEPERNAMVLPEKLSLDIAKYTIAKFNKLCETKIPELEFIR